MSTEHTCTSGLKLWNKNCNLWLQKCSNVTMKKEVKTAHKMTGYQGLNSLVTGFCASHI